MISGLAIILDTSDGLEGGSPIVYAVLNDGSVPFKGRSQRIAGCKAQMFRNRDTMMDFMVTYESEGNWLEVT